MGLVGGHIRLWAAGFQLFNEGSARVMGLGAAVTGRTDMVEAVWYNPSVTAFLEAPEFMAGLALVMPSVIQPKDWDDVVAVRLGAEYVLDSNWTLRFGYVYDPSPIDDDTRGAELPTDDRQLFNIGLGYGKGNLKLNFAYTYLLMEDTRPGKETSKLQGNYEGEAHIVAFDLDYRF